MNRYENRYVVSEYVQFLRTISNYNHKDFLSNLIKNKEKFILATQEHSKLTEMFQKLTK